MFGPCRNSSCVERRLGTISSTAGQLVIDVPQLRRVEATPQHHRLDPRAARHRRAATPVALRRRLSPSIDPVPLNRRRTGRAGAPVEPHDLPVVPPTVAVM